MSSNFYASYPIGTTGAGVPIYANVAAFPGTAATGALAVDASTGNLYEFNGTSWVQIAGPNSALALGNLDAQAGTAKGAALAGGVLSMQSASVTEPGLVNNSAQSFSGDKTFTGNVTEKTLTVTGQNFADPAAAITIKAPPGFEANGPLILDVNDAGFAKLRNLSLATNYMTFDNTGAVGINGVGNGDGVLDVIGKNSGHGLTVYNSQLSPNDPVRVMGSDFATVLAKIDNAGNISGHNLSGTNTGDVTLGTADGLSLSGQVLSLAAASTSTTGALTSTDWNTFNGKAPAGSYVTALTGDVTASGPGAAAATLATVNANVGSFNLANVTVNAKGLVTAASAPTTTGSGSVVLATGPTITSPALVTPALGVPASGTLTNVTGLPLTTGVTGILPIASGGNGVGSVTVSPTASAWSGWDSSKNFSANNFLDGYATTATAAGTTTLTVSSAAQQYFTGTTTQAVVLPVATTLVNGTTFEINNQSTGVVTVQTSGSNVIQAMAAGTFLIVTCQNTAGGTGTASWSWSYQLSNNGLALTNPMSATGDTIYGAASGVPTRLAGNTTTTLNFLAQTGTGSASAAPAWSAFVAPTVQKFTSGTGTYTTPTSPRAPLYLKIKAVGGGGGGSGGAIGTGAVAGTNGGNTTLGSTLIVAGGGTGGLTTDVGGPGGTISVSGPTVIFAVAGTAGGSSGNLGAAVAGVGGASIFGGGGMSGNEGVAGGAAATNSGSGGGGGGSSATSAAGTGGGAGGAAEVIISSPSSTYAYAIGSAGAGGAAGTSGGAGGNGAAGYLVIEEFYQ